MSLDTPTDSRVLREAVAYALSKNVVLVAAYGNEGKNSPAVYPADYPGVISVMATDQNDVRASFSNYGRPGVVAAPGVNIISAFPTGLYDKAQADGYGRIWHTPLTFVIDRKQVLRKDGWSVEPFIDEAALEATVTPLLTGK